MNQQSLTKAGLAASVMTAVAASVCCLGPIAAAFLGFSSFAALVKYEPLRPFFTATTLTFLAGSFYLAYRKRPAASCELGSVCATNGPTKVRKINRIVLWTVTVIVAVVLTFPTWSNWILG